MLSQWKGWKILIHFFMNLQKITVYCDFEWSRRCSYNPPPTHMVILDSQKSCFHITVLKWFLVFIAVGSNNFIFWFAPRKRLTLLQCHWEVGFGIDIFADSMGGFEPKVQLFYVKIKGSIIWDIYGGLNLGDDGIQLSRSKNQAGEVIFKKDAWALAKTTIKFTMWVLDWHYLTNHH